MEESTYTPTQARGDLYRYTNRTIALLRSPEAQSDLRNCDYLKRSAYSALGRLANNLATVGDEACATTLTEMPIAGVDTDKESTLQIWSTMAEEGAQIADNRLRQLLGLQRDENGNTIKTADFDPGDTGRFYQLLALLKRGDHTIAPLIHECIIGMDGKYAQHGVRLAIKAYEAGDESAFEFMKRMAAKAQEYAFRQPIAEEEPVASDADDFTYLVTSTLESLTPPHSQLEKAYVYADISLQYFAQSFLKAGDLVRATEVQALMLSKYNIAWLNAQKHELTCDPDCHSLQATADYIAVYGDDLGGHASEITDALVAGGEPHLTARYQEVYDPSVTFETIGDSYAVRGVLVALHKGGDTRAQDRLLELFEGTEDAWMAIDGLQSMGLKNKALALAKKEFAKQPNYSTSLWILHLEYDAAAMEVLQNSVSEHDRNSITVAGSRAKHLGKLAAHIVELEKTLDI
ncbi:MAG: hypothetical protein ABIR91_03000 [Candidatus Saccharimonadales bacterium]